MWRLGRQFNYVSVTAQLKLRPARQSEHWTTDRGSLNLSRALVFLALASGSPEWK
jgi:hypothetical protein